MAQREKNYVSAVVYLGGEAGCASGFLGALCERLSARFEHYELVFVRDACRGGAEREVREFLARLSEKPPVTMIHLSLYQGLEVAMNAGLDIAVGDFVYEFDTMRLPCGAEMIDAAYDACLAGSDIVSVAPRRNRGLGAALFYRLFNSASSSAYRLRTDLFRVLSRRAINRVRGMSATMPYRKAAYAASGLRMEALVYEGKAGGRTERLRFTRAVDTLALYTGIAYRLSLGVALLMLGLMLAALGWVIAANCGLVAEVAPGWTTIMLMLTGGFFGVFTLLAFVMKYLSLLAEMVFRRRSYLVESVEKIT